MARNPADGIGSRREAREMALGLLYSAEAHDADPRELLAAQPVLPGDYTGRLVKGVAENLEEIEAGRTAELEMLKDSKRTLQTAVAE